MNELLDVLSVWWIKVLIDMAILYSFIYVSRDKND